MSWVQIKNYQNGAVIYGGGFDSVAACAEHAVQHGVSLDYADLRQANLMNAQLDGAQMRHGQLAGANLTGANMSEGCYDGADFSGACLHGVCFCEGSFLSCNFDGAFFGATDIAGAVLKNCRFSTLSAFSLNFVDAAQLGACFYKDIHGAVCRFTRPPIVIGGLGVPVIFMDSHIKMGAIMRAYSDFLPGGEGALRAGHHFLKDMLES